MRIHKFFIYIFIIFIVNIITANASEIETIDDIKEIEEFISVEETIEKIEDTEKQTSNEVIESEIVEKELKEVETEEIVEEIFSSIEATTEDIIEDITTETITEEGSQENIIENQTIEKIDINTATGISLYCVTPTCEDNRVIINPDCIPNSGCGGGGPIVIDGCYDDWNDKPYSWHYNWNNSDNCWYYGCWYKGNIYYSQKGKYNNDVRHLIQLHTDGEYIYVRIKIATIYDTQFNGEDYIFYFNNCKQAAFQITDQNGKTITDNISKLPVGINPIQIRHRDGSCSYDIVQGACGYLTVYENYHNTDLEIKIPLKECKYQNCNIDIDNLKTIKFWSKNLMYKCTSICGTSTGPYILVVISIIVASTAQIIFIKRKKDIK